MKQLYEWEAPPWQDWNQWPQVQFACWPCVSHSHFILQLTLIESKAKLLNGYREGIIRWKS